MKDYEPDDVFQSKICYKVVAQDFEDEVIKPSSCLMLGIAKEACYKQVKDRDWKGIIGILTSDEIRDLIERFKAMATIEDFLYFFL